LAEDLIERAGPTERDLAAEIVVGYMTARRAMRLLRERGLIMTVAGRVPS
jgi:GntR family transcriptional regulator